MKRLHRFFWLAVSPVGFPALYIVLTVSGLCVHDFSGDAVCGSAWLSIYFTLVSPFFLVSAFLYVPAVLWVVAGFLIWISFFVQLVSLPFRIWWDFERERLDQQIRPVEREGER